MVVYVNLMLVFATANQFQILQIKKKCLAVIQNLTLTALKYFVKTIGTKGFFQFEITINMINVLVSSFRLI